MNTQIDLNTRAILNKAAAEDVYLLDLSKASDKATDQAHALIRSTIEIAQNRFDSLMKQVPHHLEAAAISYICTKGDEIIKERTERCKRAGRYQAIRFMELKVMHARRHAENQRETDAIIAAA